MRIFFVKSGSQWLSVSPQAINWIGKSPEKPNYLTIHTAERVIETKMSLKRILTVLPTTDFSMIHRSFIVSHRKISTIDQDFGFLRLGEKKLPISDSFAGYLKQKLELIRLGA